MEEALADSISHHGFDLVARHKGLGLDEYGFIMATRFTKGQFQDEHLADYDPVYTSGTYKCRPPGRYGNADYAVVTFEEPEWALKWIAGKDLTWRCLHCIYY